MEGDKPNFQNLPSVDSDRYCSAVQITEALALDQDHRRSCCRGYLPGKFSEVESSVFAMLPKRITWVRSHHSCRLLSMSPTSKLFVAAPQASWLWRVGLSNRRNLNFLVTPWLSQGRFWNRTSIFKRCKCGNCHGNPCLSPRIHFADWNLHTSIRSLSNSLYLRSRLKANSFLSLPQQWEPYRGKLPCCLSLWEEYIYSPRFQPCATSCSWKIRPDYHFCLLARGCAIRTWADSSLETPFWSKYCTHKEGGATLKIRFAYVILCKDASMQADLDLDATL